MPNDDNIIPFRPRAAALSTCALPEYEDAAPEDAAPLDDDEGAPILPIEVRPYHFEVYDHVGGKSVVDGCLPTPLAREVAALVRRRLLVLATA